MENELINVQGEEMVFPEKPTVEKKNASPIKSILNLALFIGAFYLLFDMSISFIIQLVVVLLIHEMGHFLAMKYYDYSDVKMFFIPLIGAAVTGQKEKISQKAKSIIILAGPIPGIIIGLILLLVGQFYFTHKLIYTFSLLFLFINVFNLIPIKPLDGGQLLETLFISSQTKLSKIFTVASIVILAVFSIYMKEYYFLIIPVFLLLNLRSQNKTKVMRKALVDQNISNETTFDNLTNEQYWTIRKAIIPHLSIGEIDIESLEEHKFENAIISWVKGLTKPPMNKDLRTGHKVFIILIWLMAFIIPGLILLFIRTMY